MNKKTRSILLGSTLGVIMNGAAAEVKSSVEVEPIAYKECSPIVKNMVFPERPIHCTDKSRISFMISGNNIVDLIDDSVIFNELIYKDKDVSKDKIGNNIYAVESFITVTKSANYLIFDLDIETPEFGSLQKITGSGKLTYLTATSRETSIQKNIDISKPFSFSAGPLVITNMTKHNADGLVTRAINTVFNGSSGSRLYTSKSENRLEIRSIGNIDTLSSITVRENGKKIEHGGTFAMGNWKKFYFSKPEGKVVDIEVKYWAGLREETVEFNLHN